MHEEPKTEEGDSTEKEREEHVTKREGSGGR